MKLRSQEKLDDVQLRVKLNVNQANLLKQYVTYANTQLGHHFDDEKELAVEVFRAFLYGDRGFQQWLKTKGTLVNVFKPKPTNASALTFENDGLQ